MLITRYSKISLLFAVAFWITLVALGNLTDYTTNLDFTHHVLSMDTVPFSSNTHYRAITNPIFIKLIFILIVILQITASILCLIGVYQLFRMRRATTLKFNHGKKMAIIGLSLSLLIWQFIFMDIAGEWFNMWMSLKWNAQTTSFQFILILYITLIYISIKDE